MFHVTCIHIYGLADFYIYKGLTVCKAKTYGSETLTEHAPQRWKRPDHVKQTRSLDFKLRQDALPWPCCTVQSNILALWVGR